MAKRKRKKRKIKRVKQNYLRLNPAKFGLAGGIMAGIVVFLMSAFAKYVPAWNVLLVDAYGSIGDMSTIYAIVSNFHPLLWAFLLAIYVFIDIFILTWLCAIIYNKLLK